MRGVRRPDRGGPKMRLGEHLETSQAVLDARRPRPARCRCGRTGTYRCRVCGTDWCGHCGRARLGVDERVGRDWWLTSCCYDCRRYDPAIRR
jgi:hypothetical protein